MDEENNENSRAGPKPAERFRNRRKSGDSVNSQSYTNNNNSKRNSNISDGDKVHRSIIEQVEDAVIESITVN